MNQSLIHLSYSPQRSLAAAKAAHTGDYGVFLPTAFDFIIIAFVIFMLVKQVNWFKKQGQPPLLPGPTNDEKLLMEIRNALKGPVATSCPTMREWDRVSRSITRGIQQ